MSTLLPWDIFPIVHIYTFILILTRLITCKNSAEILLKFGEMLPPVFLDMISSSG